MVAVVNVVVIVAVVNIVFMVAVVNVVVMFAAVNAVTAVALYSADVIVYHGDYLFRRLPSLFGSCGYANAPRIFYSGVVICFISPLSRTVVFYVQDLLIKFYMYFSFLAHAQRIRTSSILLSWEQKLRNNVLM